MFKKAKFSFSFKTTSSFNEFVKKHSKFSIYPFEYQKRKKVSIETESKLRDANKDLKGINKHIKSMSTKKYKDFYLPKLQRLELEILKIKNFATRNDNQIFM